MIIILFNGFRDKGLTDKVFARYLHWQETTGKNFEGNETPRQKEVCLLLLLLKMVS